jgi:hypothetical protein
MRTVSVLVVLASLTACGDGGGGPTFADDHPRIYLERNRARLAAALTADRPAAARFQRIVDLQLGGADLYDFQAWYAALLGQVTGDAAYCDYAVGHVDDAVRAEEARIAAGGRPAVAADSYLEVGAKVGDVMLTYDWCFDAASTDQKTRWLDYVAQAVWNVWHPEDATWGGAAFPWSGWSTDNPSNNYYYSFLRATMLFGLAAHGEHADARGWLDFFRDHKIAGQLVPTFEADLVGGGSREGTGYGVAMHRLWELYDVWQGSTGEDLSRLTSHTRASLPYLLHAVVPTRDRIAPIGDHARDSTGTLFDYHRNYVQGLARLFPDDPLVPQARYFLDASSVPQMSAQFMYVYDFLYEIDGVEPAPMDRMGRAYFGRGAGHLFARSSWDPDATWVSLIAGAYTESHAHRDQGSLMIYKGGWLAYDPVVESRSGIRQDEELHNLVRIVAGTATVRQREGTTSRVVALARGAQWLHVAADLTPAYGGAASVERVHRELVFIEPDCVVVFDRVATAAGTRQIWQLNAPARPEIAGPFAILAGESSELQVIRVAPGVADVTVADWAGDADVARGYRLEAALPGGDNRLLHVLSIDRAVTAATPSDAAGRIGVALELSDGRTATVRFGADRIDGALEIRDASGTVLVSEALGEGVQPLPE